MKKALITLEVPKIAEEILSSEFEVTVNEKKPLSKGELKEAVKRYDAILSMIPDKLDREVLSFSENLKVISNYATGIDNIDIAFAKSRGIAVYNVPDIVTNSTADLTFAAFLSFIRQICPAQRYVKEDKWQQWDLGIFIGEELFQKTFGIIGFGKIGKAVARRAIGFGMKVVFYNRSEVILTDDLKDRAKQVDIERVFKLSDYLALHVPLTVQTKGMINLSSMKKMVKRAVIINMARGAVINTEDLVVALKEKIIRGAVLDVTDPEPMSGKHPLARFDNCMIVPHIGSATVECRYQMAKSAAEKILFHFRKKLADS